MRLPSNLHETGDAPRPLSATPAAWRTTCDAESQDLVLYMSQIRRGDFPISIPDDVQLIERSLPREPAVIDLQRETMVVIDDQGEVAIQGATPAVEQLGAELRGTARRNRAGPQPSSGRTLAIAVDRHAAWKDIIDVVEAGLATGYSEVEFLFERDAMPPVNRLPSEIDEQLASLASGNPPEATKLALAELMTEVLSPCAGAVSLYERTRDDEAHWEILRAELPKEIRHCDCNVDLPSVKAFLHDVYHTREAYTSVRLPIDDRASVSVAAPADATWDSIQQIVVTRATQLAQQPVRFAVENELPSAAEARR
jgi:biopolymer transport protein ExbD